MPDQIIIAISGRKGAGKNTIAEFIPKYYFARSFTKQKLTVSRVNREAVNKQINDIVKHTFLECSFADNLKEFCIDTLGLKPEQCYGSVDDKNMPTQYSWNVVPKRLQDKFGHHEGSMSGRDIMQLFGTDLIRDTFGNVWAEATIRRIKKRDKPISIITDNRFPNEVTAVLQQPNGYVIRLTRSPFGIEDSHPSEAALDNFDWNQRNCYVLDNSNMTIEQQSSAIFPILDSIFKFRRERV